MVTLRTATTWDSLAHRPNAARPAHDVGMSGGAGGGSQKVERGPATALQPCPPSHGLHRHRSALHVRLATECPIGPSCCSRGLGFLAQRFTAGSRCPHFQGCRRVQIDKLPAAPDIRCPSRPNQKGQRTANMSAPFGGGRHILRQAQGSRLKGQGPGNAVGGWAHEDWVPPKSASEAEEVPPPLQGTQPMPSHCLPDAKCHLQWHL